MSGDQHALLMQELTELKFPAMPHGTRNTEPGRRQRRGQEPPAQLASASLPDGCDAGLLLEALEFLKVQSTSNPVPGCESLFWAVGGLLIPLKILRPCAWDTNLASAVCCAACLPIFPDQTHLE